jgi:hypothetical protein
MEDAHQLRLLHNRNLQWRFTNAYVDEMLSIQKMSAEVNSISLLLPKITDSIGAKLSIHLGFKFSHILLGCWKFKKSNNSVCI